MVDRRAVLIGNTVTFGILAIGCVALRLWFRISQRVFTLADSCITLATCTATVQTILQILSSSGVTNWGYGRHAVDLPVSIRKSTTPVMYLWLNQVFFKITTMMTKLSLCLVYHHLFQKADSKVVRYSRIVNYATGFFIATYYFAVFIAVTFQCTPVAKSWDTTIPGTCVNIRAIRFVTSVVNIVTSLLVIGLPLPVLFKMKHRGSELKQIIILVLLGLIHTACAIGRLAVLIVPALATNRDTQFASIPNNTAGMIEMDIGIIAASLVVMRPVIQLISHKITGKETPGDALSGSRGPSAYIHMSGSGSGEGKGRNILGA
ncbi:hypothetical protein B0J14DRAFT_250433 [Halenospora varia]|nr:hypothetical protein B0J14DRAFT_250433 [Halenospora varia]